MNAPAIHQNFLAAMNGLRAGYPSYKPHPKEWESLLRVWFERLKNYHQRVLNAAVWQAHKAFPEWFPTLGQFESVCSNLAKTSLGKDPVPPSRQLPRTTQGREAYLLEAESPCEKLARLWELEDAGRVGPVPQEEGAKRFRELTAAMEKHAAWAEQRRKAT